MCIMYVTEDSILYNLSHAFQVLYLNVSCVSEKKYDLTDYQYFKNGTTQQCNVIFFRYTTFI